MLNFENISKSFGQTKALEAVSFRVPAGATHALIGSSGSGKTTLLRIALRLIPLDTGYVRLNNQPLTSFSPAAWAAQIGYVPQEGGLYPHLTAFDNIAIIARLRGWKPDRLVARVRELAQLVDLDPTVLQRFPQALSGGQKQRVAIMRAALLDPPVMLLDEPMGALDPIVRQMLQKEFKSIFKKLNKTTVIVTHDLGEAAFLADEMTLLHKGKLIQTGTYESFVKSPNDPFVNLFLAAHRSLPEVS